jgi:multiple sugar transport system permease protein
MTRSEKLLIYVLLAAWTLVCLFPLYWLAITSLTGEDDITTGPHYLPFADFTPSLEAWAFILADPYENLAGKFINSAIVGVASTVLTVLTGGLAVYGLTRFRYALPSIGLALGFLALVLALVILVIPGERVLLAAAILPLLALAAWLRRRGPPVGNGGIMAALLATRVLPPIVIVLPIYFMAQAAGTLDSRLALIFTYTASNLPVAVWLLHPVFGARPSEQEESALLDGASHARIFFTIAVPMASAGIAAAGLLIFVLCWNEYLFAAHLSYDRAMTLPPWMVGQISMKEAQAGSEAEEWAHLSAATVLMVLPVLACTAAVQRVLSRISVWRW